jgi:hypothetical protein
VHLTQAAVIRSKNAGSSTAAPPNQSAKRDGVAILIYTPAD